MELVDSDEDNTASALPPSPPRLATAEQLPQALTGEAEPIGVPAPAPPRPVTPTAAPPLPQVLTGDELRLAAARTLRTAVDGWTAAIETALRAAVADEATCASCELVTDWATLRPTARAPPPSILAKLADDFGNRFGMLCEKRGDGTLHLSWGDEPMCGCHQPAIGWDKRAGMNFCTRHGCATCKTMFPAGERACQRCTPSLTITAIVEEGAQREAKRARTQ